MVDFKEKMNLVICHLLVDAVLEWTDSQLRLLPATSNSFSSGSLSYISCSTFSSVNSAHENQ